jgi:tRNA U34 2-thiouridine synthase MnmA/TrmU
MVTKNKNLNRVLPVLLYAHGSRPTGQSAVFYDEEDRVIGGGIITLLEH